MMRSTWTQAKLRPQSNATHVVMTRHSKIWAIGTLAIFLPFGAIVMVGFVPEANSGNEALEDLAIIVAHLVGKHGSFLTGLFFMLIGCILASLFYFWGDSLRRNDGGDGSGLLDGCGDSGDGGD